jgi:hypothetical protein
MKIFSLYLFLMLAFLGCSSPNNNLERNLEKLDKQYGYCDNPQRDLSKRDYKICKDQERAAGGSDFKFEPQSITEMILEAAGSNGSLQTFGQGAMVNVHLWNGAMQALNAYPLKNVDSAGGYIETEWVTLPDSPNQRCLVKINITSKELVSNGVNSKFICQNLINNEWQNDPLNYENESKQLTLTILNNASKSSQSNLNN